MLFNAVVMNFPTSTFFKILSIMQSVHCHLVVINVFMKHFFQLSEEHITLVNSELTCGHDASPITQDIAGLLLIEEEEGDYGKGEQFLMGIEMRYVGTV